MRPRSCLFMTALLAASILAGCAGIPISTMWKMRNFGPADFTALDAAHIRAAAQIPRDLDLKDNVTTLAVTLTRKDGSVEKLAMPLQRIAEGRLVDPGLNSAGDGTHWLLFRLTDAGVKSFQHIQSELRANHNAYEAMNMDVHLDFMTTSKQRLLSMQHSSVRLPVEIWLRLNPVDGFFELYGRNMKIVVKP